MVFYTLNNKQCKKCPSGKRSANKEKVDQDCENCPADKPITARLYKSS